MLELFPTNGLDRSVLVPVLVGLGYVTLFTELFGWPFVALVVPGYLSAVLIGAPLSGAAIVFEACLTYAFARAVGIWLPHLGAWSISFGRDRFFLLILMSVLVRLLSEGLLLPFLSRAFEWENTTELYSIGLVLVPLVANAFWNVGFARGSFYATTVTVLTYLTLRFVVLPYTNLGLAEFELTYESVALDFLASPKAYLILLAGTLLATRSNLAYGWDYNGILVPGLLAVAWYSPTKLISTLVEAGVVAVTTGLLLRIWPLRGKLIEGPRRTFLVFCIGFAFKYAVGKAALTVAPGFRVTDMYGFGYVLPTLVAVKMLQRGNVPTVVVPTLVVSLLGFLVGNAVGYALRITDPKDATPSGRLQDIQAPTDFVFQLARASAWPRLPSNPELDESRECALALVRGARQGRPGDAVPRCDRVDIAIHTGRLGGTSWYFLEPSTERQFPSLPVVAVQRGREPRGLVVASGPSGSPVSLLAIDYAARLGASAVLVASDGYLESLGDWLRALEAETDGRRAGTLHVDDRSGYVTAEWQVGFDKPPIPRELLSDNDGATVRGTRALLNAEAAESWVAFLVRAPPLASMSVALAPDEPPAPELRALYLLGQDQPSTPTLAQSTSDSDEDTLRLFGSQVVGAMHAFTRGGNPTHWQRLIADRLGFEWLVDDHRGVLLLRERVDSANGLWWLARRNPVSKTVGVSPAPAKSRLGRAVFAAHHVLGSAHVLIGGGASMEQSRRPTEDRSYRQRATEELLGRDYRIMQHRWQSKRPFASHEGNLVLSTGAATPEGFGAPSWPELEALESLLDMRNLWYDGSRRLLTYRAGSDPVLAFARRFVRNRAVSIFWPRGLLSRFDPRVSPRLEARLRRWVETSAVSPIEVARDVASKGATCDRGFILDMLGRYHQSGNPHFLRSFGSQVRRCGGTMASEPSTGIVYVVMRTQNGALFVRPDRAPETTQDFGTEAAVARALIVGAPCVEWRY